MFSSRRTKLASTFWATALGAISISLFSPPAQAGAFLEALGNLIVRPEPWSLQAAQERMNKQLLPDLARVPVTDDCQPSFVPGNDGIFRRTEYCHKKDPVQPKGFLEFGYDVPGSYLEGFTEADVMERWQSNKVIVPSFYSAKVDVPTDLLSLLNANAAQAWEKLLECEGGSGDRARELYRQGAAHCQHKNFIRSRIAEIRSSLATLAQSGDFLFLPTTDAIKARQGELRRKMNALEPMKDVEPSRSQYNSLMDQSNALFRLSLKLDIQEVSQMSFYEQILPRVPRLHPLLMQILIEDQLALLNPNESLRSSTRRFQTSQELQDKMFQLAFWGNSVIDRGCSSFGLWPSANRVAIRALGKRTHEIIYFLVGLNSHFFGDAPVVTCPSTGGFVPRTYIEPKVISDNPMTLMLLGDVYDQGKTQIWKELREVRERYVGARSDN